MTRIVCMVAVATAVTAVGCVRGETPQQRADRSAHQVTVVGCVEQGPSRDEFVIKGRTLDRAMVAISGTEPGGLPARANTTGSSADEYRTPAPGVRDDEAEQVTPKLIASAGQDFRSQVGHRVVVFGEFMPASTDQPLDQVKVNSIEPVANNCLVQ